MEGLLVQSRRKAILSLALLQIALGRLRLSFNADWRFRQGLRPQAADPSVDDSGWRQVSVPHDFVVEGNFTPTASISHGYLPMTSGWYRKHFELPEDWQGSAVWIEFDGVFRNSDVYLNGQLLGHHDSGYTSFFYYLGSAAVYGSKNLLSVFCDASKEEGWWYEGGGIYRHVWLNKANNIHIVPWGLYASAVITGNIDLHGQTNTAYVLASAEVFNAGNQASDIQIHFSISDGEHALQAMSSDVSNAIPEQATSITESNLTLEGQLKLWSPGNPRLYRLTVELFREGALVDSAEVLFGLRKVEFGSQGLLLNGVPTKVQGVCNHQDFAGVGTAMPMGLQRFRIEKLKELGVNAWRMSHNPPNPELLDYLDEAGMIVWDETRNFGDQEQWIRDFADMVKRDRNHPSILFWSICNEGWRPEGCKGGPEGLRIARLFKHVLQKLDPHGQRAMTAAMDSGWGSGMSEALDVQGVNYNYEVYAPFHASYPNVPLIGSETASCSTDRGTYVPALGKASAYASLRGHGCTTDSCLDTCLQDSLMPAMMPDFVIGGFVWTGFDYKGEPTPDAWPTVGSHYGAMFDIAGFEKDAYFYYKSWWTKEPVLHILPHWNWEHPDEYPASKVKVWIYTNAAKVSLHLNGELHGIEEVKKYGHASFHVPYKPGNLTAVALSSTNEVLQEETLLTSGHPKSLTLQVRWGATGISSSVENNVALVGATVVDVAGRTVPTASHLISFAVSGSCKPVISGVGNGDPSSLEADKSSQRQAFAGRALAVVQCRGEAVAGDILVIARSKGLEAASVRIPVLAGSDVISI